MIRGLLEKELRQHSITLGFLFVAIAGGALLLSHAHQLHHITGTTIEGFHIVVSFFAPLACFILAQILIAGEFRHKTQLFLEGLPLPRWRMLAVKYGLGLGLIIFAVGAAFVVSVAFETNHRASSSRFVTIVGARSFVWVWFSYSLFFAHGFLGRYRLLFAAIIYLGAYLLYECGVDLSRFSAALLVDQTFAFEAFAFPTAALWETAAMAAALTAAGFGLGLMRDATLASLLAERMSGREKSALTFLCVAMMMGAGYIMEKKKAQDPVALAGAYEIERGPVRVSAAPAVDVPRAAESAALKQVATDVAADLEAAANYLGCTSMPPVFIVHRRDFAADRFENGELEPEQGLLVRVKVTEPDFHEPLLRRWILREVFKVKGRGRANLEKNAWVLDGFPLWWAELHGEQPAPAAQPPEFTQAVAAMPSDFSADTLRNWYRIRKDAGDEKARALAWTGLSTLAAAHGRDACQKFLASMLAPDFSKNARGWLHDTLNPMSRRFHMAAGMSLTAFIPEWRAALQREGSKSTALAAP